MAEIAFMVAETAGGALLEVVFQKLIDQLASPELRKNSVVSKLNELDGKLNPMMIHESPFDGLTAQSGQAFLSEESRQDITNKTAD